jgi:DNA-binding PadR family transcriptional regulator
MEPLTPAVFLILLALAGEARHGYGIMQESARLTDGEIRMGPGTLYGTLKRMLEAGPVEECGRRGAPRGSDERRRYYRLTPGGHAAAVPEAERLLSPANGKALLRRPRTA